MRPFGLQNTGVICYFNSLMQGIISSPAFVKKIEEKSDSTVAEITSAFLRSCENKAVRIFTVVPILKQVTMGHTFFGRQQEDASEGFDLFIDKIGPNVESIFTSKWRTDIYCDVCKNMVSSASDVMNRLIMEKSFVPLYDEYDPFEAYMSANMSEFNDYTCASCKTKNVRGMKVARLMEPPGVYVVSFNKFMSKWSIKYPEVVSVRYGFAYNKIAKYKLVAIIRHFGTRNGGHYNATVVRYDGVYNVDDASFSKSAFTPSDNDYILIFSKI